MAMVMDNLQGASEVPGFNCDTGFM
jgi:hypothetical protein